MYGWIQAMDEALVTSHLGVADKSDSYDTAKRKLDELIDWHIAVATDPRVNGGKVLVPVEATEEMIEEGWKWIDIRRKWGEMVAAAPDKRDTNA